MSCTNCGYDVTRQPAEVNAFDADGVLQTLPRAFCADCGWPLGQVRLGREPRGELVLGAVRETELKLVLSNDGEGALYYSLVPDPKLRPVSLPTLAGQVLAGDRRTIGFRLDPDTVRRPHDQVSVTVHTLTRLPDVQGQSRQVAITECWQTETITVPVVAVESGPLEADSHHLLFGLGLDENYLELLNFGGAPLTAEVRASQGYLVSLEPGRGFEARGRVTLRPGRPHDPQRPRPGITSIRVQAPVTASPVGGELLVQAAGLPPVRVQLEQVQPSRPPLPPYRYAIGIDFGTSKTAVVWIDQYALPPTPRVLEWPRTEPGTDPRWLPSAVFYDKKYRQPSFGDAALQQSGANVSDVGVRLTDRGRFTNERGTLFVGMKMFVQEDSPPGDELSLDQVITDYFGHLFRALAERAQLELGEAAIVLSLPVLSDPEAYRRQEERTRAAAARAGELFGIRGDQILVEQEPVCAAIDVVRSQSEQNGTLKSGEWLCVFDCGAGTTDISLLEVTQQGSEWRFAQIEPLGYEWGGDSVDQWIFRFVFARWCNPDDPGQIPAAGPVTIKPLKPPRENQAIDADAPSGRASTVDWYSYMLEQELYQFQGASLPVSQSELLGEVRRFKEQYLTTLADRPSPSDPLTTATPIRHLPAPQRSDQGPWAPLDLVELINQISLEFHQMRGDAEEPLRVQLPALCTKLRVLRPDHVCPVGGGTLIQGWREAVEREPLGMRNILTGDSSLRRLHVARGAAQKVGFRVEDQLPAAARLAVGRWRPGEELEVEHEALLTAGSPPGDQQWAQLVATLPLEPPERLLFRVELGDRRLKQAFIAAADGRAALAAAGVGLQSVVRLQARLRYLRKPTRLELSCHWLLVGEPTAFEPVTVELPPFED